MGEQYGSCTMCGDPLPSPSSAGHQCVGRVTFAPTGAAPMAATPPFVINPPSTFNALPSPHSQIESLQRLLAQKDAQIAAQKETIERWSELEREDSGRIDRLHRALQSANERIEALTAAQMCDCCDGKGNTLSGAPCVCTTDEGRGRGTIFGERMGLRLACYDLQSQLSALQRAAREYMDVAEGIAMGWCDDHDEIALRAAGQALLDLLP